MKQLTVCIPAYNAAETIERAIRSIRVEEASGDVEILVCDDGSTDDTWSVLEQLSAEIPQISMLRHRDNLGRPAARNKLLEAATGRFLTWLDADDEKYPGMLRAQLDRLGSIEDSSGSAGLEGVLVFTDYDWWPMGQDRPRLVQPDVPTDPMRSLLDSSFGGYLWLMMGLRETFLAAGPFDPRLPRLQDLGFFIRFAELGGRFDRVDHRGALCVYHKSDQGRNAAQVWRSWTRIWRMHRHHFTSYGLAEARRWRRHHYRVARRYARNNDDKLTFAVIAALEVVYVVTGRLRRVVFDA